MATAKAALPWLRFFGGRFGSSAKRCLGQNTYPIFVNVKEYFWSKSHEKGREEGLVTKSPRSFSSPLGINRFCGKSKKKRPFSSEDFFRRPPKAASLCVFDSSPRRRPLIFWPREKICEYVCALAFAGHSARPIF